MVAVTAGRAYRPRRTSGVRRAVVQSRWTDERFVARVDAVGDVVALSGPLAEGEDGRSAVRLRTLTDLGERLFYWSAGRYEFIESLPRRPGRRPRHPAHRGHPEVCPAC